MTHITIFGAGYVGLTAALALEKLLDPNEAELTIVNPENYALTQPLLPEVASGTIAPRNAVVPLRRVLRRTRVVMGELVDLDLDGHVAEVHPPEGQAIRLAFDHAVLGLGSVSRLLPVPGLEEHAVGFTSLAEAIHLRNAVLERLEAAEASRDTELRQRLLTFVFVGGGYTGVEAIAELEDLAREVADLYPSLRRDDMRWILVEATEHILPTISPRLREHATAELRRHGIDVRLETTVESIENGVLTLSSGERIAAELLVWSTGVQPHPLLADIGLPVDEKGRLRVDRELRVEGRAGLWGAGDAAAVPDGQGGTYPPTAQHALREGRHLAKNLVATLRGEQPKPFAHTAVGELVTLGHRKGVGEVYGHAVSGLPAWLLRRAYYAAQMPTLERKLRLVVDMLAELPFPREAVHLGSAEHPGRPLGTAKRVEAGRKGA